MFELIEEPLSSPSSVPIGATPTPPASGTPVKGEATNIYTMPEKFLPKAGKSSLSPAVFILIGILLLGSVGAGVYFFIMQGSAPIAQLPPTTSQPTPTPTPETPPLGGEEVPTPVPATPTPTPEMPPLTAPPVSYVDSIDTDRDGLTDVEEQLFNTGSDQPDTDSDGYLDAGEVKALFDPTKGDRATLANSGFVSVYRNSLYSYALLYPSSWVAQAIDSTSREVLLSSATGEFISVSIQDNPERLSALDWYSSVKSPGFDTSKLETLVYGNWSGLVSEDQLEIYLVQRDGDGQAMPYVYVLKYAPGSRPELNFRSTFQMIVRSIMSDLASS